MMSVLDSDEVLLSVCIYFYTVYPQSYLSSLIFARGCAEHVFSFKNETERLVSFDTYKKKKHFKEDTLVNEIFSLNILILAQ